VFDRDVIVGIAVLEGERSLALRRWSRPASELNHERTAAVGERA